MTDEKLLELALDARKNAYVPYSGYAVGAALLTEDGKVFGRLQHRECGLRQHALRRAHRAGEGRERGLSQVHENRDCVQRVCAVSVRRVPSVAL